MARDSWRENIKLQVEGPQFGLGAVVSNDSWMTLKRSVQDMGSNLYSELHYDGRPYSADAPNPPRNMTAFLWVNRTVVRSDRVPVTGGCCFDLKEYRDTGSLWLMQWIWMHPSVRNQGMLTRAWPYFEQRFGRFVVQAPLSETMTAFLKSKTRYSRWLRGWGIDPKTALRS